MEESINKVVLHWITRGCSYYQAINFAKSEIVPSDHGLETHAFQPLFKHSDVTAQLITEQTTVMDDLRISAKIECLFWLIFHLSRGSVIKIGSD